MLIAMMVQAGVAEAAAFDHPWLTISRSVARIVLKDDIAVVGTFEGKELDAKRLDRVRVTRTRMRNGRVATTISYTDSRACPALARLGAGIGDFPLRMPWCRRH